MAENDWTQDFYLKRGYERKEDVQEAIKETKESIQFFKELMMINTMASPETIIPDEWKDDSAIFIRNLVMDALDGLEENIILLFKLESLLENFDKALILP